MLTMSPFYCKAQVSLYRGASFVHLSTFPFKWLLLKNGCRDLLQTWHKCSLWGANQVLLHLM